MNALARDRARCARSSRGPPASGKKHARSAHRAESCARCALCRGSTAFCAWRRTVVDIGGLDISNQGYVPSLFKVRSHLTQGRAVPLEVLGAVVAPLVVE